ncbi:carboxymuconolactone decarboxylase family protein [Arenibacter sp. GZD96]|uniref:carboxymuconolactone decarboxylase family protein n=1 Tax=Aurantibrevibacter litoralis TaxID=3106030 RepID=UPI002AFEC93B|nr:carboxymuconolactone decarboxylase family protein [Arenibacter sp. GZD-96]MEA1784796.1 carboxymuconolactone decarboxylase family protein [Arenibacter sp. GZD-96]
MNEVKVEGLEPKTIENAHPVAAEILEKTKKAMGVVPNMYAGMAINPSLLDSYAYAYNSFRAHSGFSSVEQEVILLSVAVENNCDYCVAAHSFVGDKMSGVPTEITDAIRDGKPVSDKKLAALSTFSKIMTSSRGNATQEEIDAFLAAGYTPEHVLGVITGIGVKTFSNYFNHINHTEVDAMFASRAWKKH